MGPRNLCSAFARERGADRFDEVEAFVAELFRLGKRANYDAFLIAVQSAVETGDWSSSWWRERLNPGGIGIIGDPVHDAGSRTWANGRDAARAMLVHHAAYLGGQVPEALRSFIDLDPRFEAAVERVRQVGPVVHWDDYGNGNWAEDPEYFEAILARAQAVRAVAVPPDGGGGEEPTMAQPTAVLDKSIDGHRFESRFDADAGVQGAPRYIVLHIQEGTNEGTWNLFR